MAVVGPAEERHPGAVGRDRVGTVPRHGTARAAAGTVGLHGIIQRGMDQDGTAVPRHGTAPPAAGVVRRAAWALLFMAMGDPDSSILCIRLLALAGQRQDIPAGGGGIRGDGTQSIGAGV